MADQNESTATIPRLRTFAGDLTRVRAARKGQSAPREDEKAHFSNKPTLQEIANQTIKKTVPVAPQNQPTLKAAAPNLTNTQPIHEPRSEAKEPAHLASIPSFHELKKHGHKKPKLSADDLEKVATPKKESVLEQKSKTVNLEDESSMGDNGVVITDTKRGRFNFFSSVYTSLAEWAGDLKKSWIDDRKPVYTINETSNRARRGAKTTRNDVADHRVVVERLKKRSRTTKPHEVVTPKETPTRQYVTTPAPHPEWRHVTNKNGEELRLLEDAHDETPAPAPSIQTPPAPTVPQEKPVVVPDVVPEQPKVVTPAPVQQESTPAPAPEPKKSEPQPQGRSAKGSLIPNKAAWAKRVEDTNTLSLGVVAIVAVVVMVIVVGRVAYIAFTNTDQPQTVALAEPLLKNTSVQQHTLTDVASFIAAIRASTDDIVIIELTDNTSTTALSPVNFFTALQINPNDALLRTTRHVVGGGHDGTHPFLVLDIENKENALGGMLAWETSLNTELAPLFGNTLLETKIEDHITGYTDKTIVEADVRILYDTNKIERIVYGFVGNVLIITTNPVTFAAVAERVK